MSELTLQTLLNAGPIPLLVIIAWLLWRIDHTQTILHAGQLERDSKLNEIHSDVKAVIRRLAGLES